MDERTIKDLYVEKPDEEVRLHCSYTTRREGFLDILLSGIIMCSEEVDRLLGKVKTHRGSSMAPNNSESIFDLNNYISLSTGFVSFKYSESRIKKREDYIGGLGILIPLDRILREQHMGIHHCSSVGGIKNYALNRDNIKSAVHQARKKKVLYDDGYGNVFEISLLSELEQNERELFPKVISYPKIELNSGVIIAIPEFEREQIVLDLLQRQKDYKCLLDKIHNKKAIEQFIIIEDRALVSLEQTIQLIGKMTKPFEMDNLPVCWYQDKNLDVALMHLSI